ncbi:MAG TPA: hypothetical protein VEC01_08435 [Noviherbaspirillum sp.]|uniref:hypothetical protein n=1 Tax=Noviherbaspirillum sp. TaxID=1926288 RepID=UPI002D5ACE72|nr:hypothetical protein [Noviherbaspirillum sp.]HYD95339.1 hypothetical protein [Noviherbaspirillum sp.]
MKQPPDSYDPNRLFDVLIHRFQLDDDRALAHALHVDPALIARIRYGEQALDPSLLIRVNEIFDINMRELRRLMGDRRAEYRLSAVPPPAATPAGEPERRPGEQRGRLRRTTENDDAGMPNFVQWS